MVQNLTGFRMFSKRPVQGFFGIVKNFCGIPKKNHLQWKVCGTRHADKLRLTAWHTGLPEHTLNTHSHAIRYDQCWGVIPHQWFDVPWAWSMARVISYLLCGMPKRYGYTLAFKYIIHGTEKQVVGCYCLGPFHLRGTGQGSAPTS